MSEITAIHERKGRERRAPCIAAAGFVWLLASALLVLPPAEAEENPPPAPQTGWQPAPAAEEDAAPTKPVVEKLAEGRYLIGAVELDQNKREIYLSGQVNMQEGLIELFACGPRGKLHESVLVLDVVPYHLQVALILLGLKSGGGLEYQGDPRAPTGDPVEVWVEWDGADSTAAAPEMVQYRAEDMVYNVAKEQAMAHTPFVFAGSRIQDGRFVANVEQSLITTFHDPYAILDNPLPTGGDDTLYVVNQEVVPPRGTPVRVTLKAVSAPAGASAKEGDK